ncbi:MAG: twin-arginine translocase TatA/TatE family subunit [Plesiomonas sp.]
MGFSGIGIQELLLIGLIVVLVFGTKNLRNVGRDLGGAVRDFKRALNGSTENKTNAVNTDVTNTNVDMPIFNEQKSVSPDNKSSS